MIHKVPEWVKIQFESGSTARMTWYNFGCVAGPPEDPEPGPQVPGRRAGENAHRCGGASEAGALLEGLENNI